MSAGFYKIEDEIANINNLLYGPNFVLNANYELRVETKNDFTYPIDGWYWFDSVTDAYTFFGIVPPEI